MVLNLNNSRIKGYIIEYFAAEYDIGAMFKNIKVINDEYIVYSDIYEGYIEVYRKNIKYLMDQNAIFRQAYDIDLNQL